MTFNASTLNSDWLGGLTVYFMGRATCSEFLTRLKKTYWVRLRLYPETVSTETPQISEIYF